jgi:purine-binding chemotaxis protein CheW
MGYLNSCQWYDSHDPPNLVVHEVLKRFDAPHRAIHSVAVDVAALMATGKADEALNVVASARAGVLNKMIELFRELRELARDSQREIAVVLATNSGKCAVCVDSVDAVEPLASGSLSNLPQFDSPEHPTIAKRIGRRSRSGELVLILDPESICERLPGSTDTSILRGPVCRFG